jgi:hypothetical protein
MLRDTSGFFVPASNSGGQPHKASTGGQGASAADGLPFLGLGRTRFRYQLAFQGHSVGGLPARGRAIFEGGEVFQHLRHQPAPGLATRGSVCVYRASLPAPTDHPAGATSSLPATSAFQATTPFAALLAAVHLSILATQIGLWWADSVQLLAMGDS